VKKHFTLRLMVTALIVSLIFSMASVASAHSGRTDSSGGHNCSQKSKSKGLCSGYHYHNGGSSSSNSSSSSSKSSSAKSSSSSSKASSSSSSKQAKNDVKTSDVSLYVNGELIVLSNKPLVKSNSTYFPIREVATAIEASLSFNDDKTKVTLTRDKKSVSFQLNGKEIITRSNTTYAPIRNIVEKLGGKVKFDASSNSIYVEI